MKPVSFDAGGRTMKWVKRILFSAVIFLSQVAPAQDSVDVTFRWNVSGHSAYSVPGEFNGWSSLAWPMQYQGGDLWVRMARLRANPSGGGIPGAYQYKFYYTGASPWPNDPLNHHVNPLDNDNSFLYVKDPTIYHLLPNQRSGIITTNYPTVSAYLYPRVGTVLDTSALSLQIDDTTITNLGSFYDVATQQLVFTTPFALSDGSHIMTLTAGSSLDTVSFIVAIGSPPILPLPSYARHGVTLPSPASNDSTTFRILVGGTTFVFLRIALAGEPVQSQPAMVMRKDPSSDNWWLNIDLPVGDYEYQYQTDDGTFIYDPWGRRSGLYGSRFSTGLEGLSADDYVWQSSSYQRPPQNKLVVYELHVGEFAGGYYGLGGGEAGFYDLTTLIPYFDSLGVNAIELMPINDFALIGQSGHSWGYDISHYFALEPSYGVPRDFKVLVDSAHARGIAVIVDVVFNHLNDPAPLWQMQPDEVANPYFKPYSVLRHNEDPLFFFKDMDHWSDETQELIYDVLKMWIDDYHVDGFRFDFTQGIGWDTNEPTRGILGWSNVISQEYGGSVYQIAEHLPESPALIYYSGLTGGWHDSYHDEIFDEARFRNTPLIDFENLILDLGSYLGNDVPSSPGSYANRTEPVNMNVDHDEQSLIYEMVTFQGVDTATALIRDRLYATFMFTSLGIPMLWEGEEFSAPRGWMTGDEKLSYRPVEWNLYPTARGQTHYDYYKKLVFQRTRNPALYNGTLQKLFRYNTEKVLVWGFEETSTGSQVMAVANLSSLDRTVANVPWLSAGTWYDIFDQNVFVADSTMLDTFSIPAYTARVYSNLSDSVLSTVQSHAPELPKEFSLYQNYPNPFNPGTTISFSLPKAGDVELKVYDVLGREVAVLASGQLGPGVYTRTWNGRTSRGSPAGSGVYFCRLQTQGFNSVRKMFLVR